MDYSVNLRNSKEGCKATNILKPRRRSGRTPKKEYPGAAPAYRLELPLQIPLLRTWRCCLRELLPELIIFQDF